MTMTTTLRALALGLGVLTAAACSSSEEPERPPVQPSDDGGAEDGAVEAGADAGDGDVPQALSQAFTSYCATCHGASGEGTGVAPQLPGDNDVESFVSTVRDGRGGMPPFTEATISDEDLRADYRWLAAQQR